MIENDGAPLSRASGGPSAADDLACIAHSLVWGVYFVTQHWFRVLPRMFDKVKYELRAPLGAFGGPFAAGNLSGIPCSGGYVRNFDTGFVWYLSRLAEVKYTGFIRASGGPLARGMFNLALFEAYGRLNTDHSCG